MKGFFPRFSRSTLVFLLCAAMVLSLCACSGGGDGGGDGGDDEPDRDRTPVSDREIDRDTEDPGDDIGDPEPEEPPAFLAGQELAAEADPLGKAVENIYTALSAYAETVGAEMDQETYGRARAYETVYDPLYGEDVAVAGIDLADLHTYIWIGWRVETGALAFLCLNIYEGADKDALTAAVYSDTVARGVEESMIKCREARPFEQNWTSGENRNFDLQILTTYEVRSAGGMALMTTDNALRLYWLGGDLKLEGDYLYFLDGGEAVIYGLWYRFFEQSPEEIGDLYIPDTLGGCPVTRVRLSPCDGWSSVLFDMNWISFPTTARDVAVELNDAQYIIPNARRLSVMYRPYAREGGMGIRYAKFICLNRDMEAFMVPEDPMWRPDAFIDAYWGSAIAGYAERYYPRGRLDYLDAVDGSWEQTEAAIRDRSALELAVLAGGDPKDTQGLTDEDVLAVLTREELMEQARSCWEDAVGELLEEVPQEYPDALAKAREGDAGPLIEFLKNG